MATYKLVDSDKLDAAMTATADAIRAKTGGTDPIAWDAEKGMSEAVEPVFEAGKKSEYDAFWNSIDSTSSQNVGIFAGRCWNNTTFNPKNDMILKGNLNYSFYSCHYNGDFVELCQRNNITFSMVNVTMAMYAFQFSLFTRLGILNVSSADASGMCASMSKIETIDKIILTESTNVNNLCYECPKLENLIIEGVIGRNKFNLQWSTLLSKNSILSIINALSSYTSSLTITLSQTAVNTAFETTAGAADGSTSEEWAALIATKPNWTISLA